MKHRCFFFAFILALAVIALALSGCGSETDSKLIYIAVTGDRDEFSSMFDAGIKKAYEDVCEEYKDSGYKIVGAFFDDDNDYEKAERITSKLMKTDSVTAIISSNNYEIIDNQVYQCDKYDKVLICPFGVKDKSADNSYWQMTFSTAFSNYDVGYSMGKMAESEKPGGNWVVCYDDSPVAKEKIQYLRRTKGINIIDIEEISEVVADFRRETDFWRAMDADGIFIVTDSHRDFDFYYSIKDAFPDACIVTDSCLDNVSEWKSRPEYFSDIILSANFYTDYDEYSKQSDQWNDTWFVHGYNAFRMVVDTAIAADSTKCEDISGYLYDNGYEGKFESYRFNDKGLLDTDYLVSYKRKNGKTSAVKIKKQ